MFSALVFSVLQWINKVVKHDESTFIIAIIRQLLRNETALEFLFQSGIKFNPRA